MVTGVITTGFILLFGVTGLVIGVGASFVVSVMPWLGMGIGVLLAVAGSWMLSGGKLYTGVAGRVANRIGNPNQVGFRGYFLFGLSYGTASLSCTLPIFLVVVGTTLAVSGIPAAVAQFVLYAMGMGFIIMLLTVGMALFQSAVVSTMRKALPYIQLVSAGMMILAGSYIVFYWLTLGGLL
jgi:cytochrome c biogenesis protein CcdA